MNHRPALGRPLKELRNAVDLIIESTMRKGEQLISKLVEPARRAWEQHSTSLDHRRLPLQPDQLVPLRYVPCIADS